MRPAERFPTFGAICLAALASACAATAQPPEPRGALAPGRFAIVGVNVIPMTHDTVLLDHTVIVRNGRVAAVGPAAGTTVPAGATRISGAGRWLIPGLADTHTHLFSDGELPDSIAPAELGVIVANGITAARLMIGTPEHLVLRSRIARGEIIGPQLWVASPQFADEPQENGIAMLAAGRRALAP